MKEYKKRQNNREPLHKHQPPPKRKERPKGTTVANRRKKPKSRFFRTNSRQKHAKTAFGHPKTAKLRTSIGKIGAQVRKSKCLLCSLRTSSGNLRHSVRKKIVFCQHNWAKKPIQVNFGPFFPPKNRENDILALRKMQITY